MAVGADASAKMLSFFSTLPVALASWWPSLHPLDLLVGLCCCGAAAGCVPEKQERQEVQARHGIRVPPVGGTHEDIAPYIDPVFQNNVILTKTESLTMNSRPKDPKTARNKNVLVIGGSGSGKTRFWAQTESDADAQFLCGHRPEGNHFGGVRKNAPKGRTQAGERRKAYEG